MFSGAPTEWVDDFLVFHPPCNWFFSLFISLLFFYPLKKMISLFCPLHCSVFVYWQLRVSTRFLPDTLSEDVGKASLTLIVFISHLPWVTCELCICVPPCVSEWGIHVDWIGLSDQTLVHMHILFTQDSRCCGAQRPSVAIHLLVLRICLLF